MSLFSQLLLLDESGLTRQDSDCFNLMIYDG